MTDTVLFILEIVGTAVFAASGALAGLQRQLDAFGVVILGVCTACGGGVIRDLTLGITPPVMFCQPVYALVAMGVSALVFLPAVRHLLAVESRAYELVMLWLDSIGLGLFTAVEPKTLEACFELYAEGTAAEGAELDITTVPAEGRCLDCGHKFPMTSPRCRCPECGSLRLEGKGGRDFLITGIDAC